MLHTTLLSLIIVGVASSVSAQHNLQISSAALPTENCLDVELFGPPVPTLRLFDCDYAQQWNVNPGPNPIRFAILPNYCLDGIDLKTDNKVEVRKCDGSPAQQWAIDPFADADGCRLIRGGSQFGDRCLNVDTNTSRIVTSLNCVGGAGGSAAWHLVGVDLSQSLTSQNLD